MRTACTYAYKSQHRVLYIDICSGVHTTQQGKYYKKIHIYSVTINLTLNFVFLSEHYFNDSRGYLEVAEMSFGGVFARSF